MKRLLSALIILSAACSQDSTGPRFPSVADLAGRWNLTGLVFVGVPDSSRRLDVKARFGVSATLSIAPGGRAIITATVQGSESADTAAIALHADTLTYTRANSYSLAYILRGSGQSMTWTAVQTDDSFDLDGDGTPDVAREIDTWQRF